MQTSSLGLGPFINPRTPLEPKKVCPNVSRSLQFEPVPASTINHDWIDVIQDHVASKVGTNQPRFEALQALLCKIVFNCYQLCVTKYDLLHSACRLLGLDCLLQLRCGLLWRTHLSQTPLQQEFPKSLIPEISETVCYETFDRRLEHGKRWSVFYASWACKEFRSVEHSGKGKATFEFHMDREKEAAFFLQARPAWHHGAWHALAGVIHKSTARKILSLEGAYTWRNFRFGF